jgi:hypothetical protein
MRHACFLLLLGLFAGPERRARADPPRQPVPVADRDECSIEGERCVAVNFERRRAQGRRVPQQDCISCILRCKSSRTWPFNLCPNR